MHLYLTCRYLNVPTHGSPNTELLANRVQLPWSSQLPCTTESELAALQLVVRILGWGHVWRSCLPYDASSTMIVAPPSQLMLLLSCSQMVTDITFSKWNNKLIKLPILSMIWKCIVELFGRGGGESFAIFRTIKGKVTVTSRSWI